MERKQISRRGKAVIMIIVQTVIVLGVFFLRLSYLRSGHPVLHSLCDGFFVGGASFLGAGLISAAAARGGLDGFFYVCRIVANMFSTEKAMQGKPRFLSYSEYQRTQGKHPGNGKLLLLIGGASFAVSAVLYALLAWMT